MASNTGCTSVGDWLITRRISAVAVCCSRASVLDRDHGLVGEGLQQLDLAVGERSGLGARHHDDTDGSALPQHGDKEAAPKPDRAGQRLMLVLGIDLDVGDVDNRALEDRPPCEDGPGWARRKYAAQLLEGFGGVVVLSDRMDQLAIELKERAEEAAAQSHGASDDRVEDRLHIGLRLADDT